MNKRQLISKVVKGASVALLAGGMVCGTSLAGVNAANTKSKTAATRLVHSHKGHKAVKKSHAKRGAHKTTKKTVKKPAKKASKRTAAHKAHKLTKKAVKKAVKPEIHKAYHHHKKAVRNFRKSAYYRNVWTSAKKINVRGIRFDQKKLNRVYKYRDAKGVTRAERRAYNRSARYLKGKINYLNWYVHHDEHMLSLI